jgi:hypothetical protein
MPMIHFEAEGSRESLLKAVDQLNSTELDEFVQEVLNLRARRRPPDRLPSSESKLLARINDGLSDGLRIRYAELISHREQEILTSEEHDELLRLTEEVERREVDRLSALAELAQSKGVPLPALMLSLGIPSPSDG